MGSGRVAQKARNCKARQQRVNKGLCRNCSRPRFQADKTHCDACLILNRETNKRLYRYNKQMGICTSCTTRRALPNNIRCIRCKTMAFNTGRKNRKRDKDAAFAAYGGWVCNCCGEAGHQKFLTIDHINNDGYKTRKEAPLYIWLKDHNYPEGLCQVLCWNCNLGKYHNGGTCPHKE